MNLQINILYFLVNRSQEKDEEKRLKMKFTF